MDLLLWFRNAQARALMWLTALALCILVELSWHHATCQSLIVSTENGRVRGILGTSRDGRTYVSFLGIPYAIPPVGPLRFEVSAELTVELIVECCVELPGQ